MIHDLPRLPVTFLRADIAGVRSGYAALPIVLFFISIPFYMLLFGWDDVFFMLWVANGLAVASILAAIQSTYNGSLLLSIVTTSSVGFGVIVAIAIEAGGFSWSAAPTLSIWLILGLLFSGIGHLLGIFVAKISSTRRAPTTGELPVSVLFTLLALLINISLWKDSTIWG